MTAFAICNNVTPVPDDPHIGGTLDIQNPAMMQKGRGTVQLQKEDQNLFQEDFNQSPAGLRKSFVPARNANSNQRPSGRNRSSKMILQASSPDEVALVKYSNALKMELIERDRTYVQIQNCQGTFENYDIIANFPFSSQSKKMSVLLQQKETGKIIYYVKGAEVVMEGLMKPSQRPLLLEFCEQLAMDGLRTLVFAQKVLTEDELNNFMEAY